MSNKEKDLGRLEDLRMGSNCGINWFEEGGAIVYNCNGVYVMFEVTQYGVSERYEGTYLKKDLARIIEIAYSWT